MDIIDIYSDGEAAVTAYACGCEHVDTHTYEAWFPCSTEHGDKLTINAERKAA